MKIQGKGTDIFANVQLKLIDTEVDFVGSSGRLCTVRVLILDLTVRLQKQVWKQQDRVLRK
jgi:hypothetical protein